MSAKPDLWMPLYIGDYLADTSRLTTVQHGAYLLLMMDYWKSGPPPDDDEILAQIVKMTPDAWSMLRASLARFFKIKGGEWRHKRIDAELEKASDQKAARKQKAKAAADARWGSSDDAPSNARSNATSTPQAMLEECPSPSPSPSPSESPSPPPSPTAARAAVSAPSAARGSVLPDDWEPKALSPGTNAAAVVARNGIVWTRRAREKFENYWRSKSGKDATRRDWQATWANWVIEEDRRDSRNGSYRNGSGTGGRAEGDGFSRALQRAADHYGPDDFG